MTFLRNNLRRLTESPYLLAGLLFILALAVRLPYLGTFLTVDEVKWLEGGGQFLTAIYNGTLAKTYWHFHPGITLVWGEAIIMWGRWLTMSNGTDLPSFVTAQLSDLAGLSGAMRLSGVFITSLTIPALYWLTRRLLGNAPALIGAILLAINQFVLAHSRIINGDATTALFMLLSTLAFLWLWQGSGLRMAALSGAWAGLALLTKLPSPIIIPWIGLLALIGYGQKRSFRFWAQALVLWGLTAVIIYVAIWPAMWVAPLNTLQLIYHDAFEVGEVGSGHSAFFMGQISDDPGWIFYPVAIAFRLTPVTSVGIVLAALWLIFGWKSQAATVRRVGWTLAAFALFVILTANFSPKKLDRYVMGVFPALDLLAAVGLWGIWQELTKVWPRIKQGGMFAAIFVVAAQGIFTLSHYPYLLTGYNPLLGGITKAAKTMPVGWGEGMEQAATWLNAQPNAQNLRASAWYSDIFHPYFVGQQASFSDDGRSQLAADYVVFYVNQIQRQKPYPGLVNYFRSGEPVFVVDFTSTGQPANLPVDDKTHVHWVEVYKAPAAQSAGGAPKVEGMAQLLAYKITNANGTERQDDSPNMSSRNNLDITLFFRTLGPLPPDTLFGVALVPFSTGQDLKWGEWQQTEIKDKWVEGDIVEWRGNLTLPADIPAGQYRLWVAFQFKDGPVIAEFSISEKDPPIKLE